MHTALFLAALLSGHPTPTPASANRFSFATALRPAIGQGPIFTIFADTVSEGLHDLAWSSTPRNWGPWTIRFLGDDSSELAIVELTHDRTNDFISIAVVLDKKRGIGCLAKATIDTIATELASISRMPRKHRKVLRSIVLDHDCPIATIYTHLVPSRASPEVRLFFE